MKKRLFTSALLARAWDEGSYRAGIGQRVVAKSLLQGIGCEHLGLDAGQLFDFDLDAGKTVQRGFALNGIDQNVQITAVCIVTPQRRAENARIFRIVFEHDAANAVTVNLQGGRRFQGEVIAVLAPSLSPTNTACK